MNRVEAAVALITRSDTKILVVWNKRYGRWAMPGGRVEDGETPVDAVCREVTEETGLEVRNLIHIYEGPHNESVASTRGSYVHVFAVTPIGEPREREEGCPITWFSREEFLKWGLAPDFYRKMFDR